MRHAASGLVRDADVSAFENDGAVCIRQIVDEAWVERMQNAVRRVMAAEPGDKPRFRSMLYLWQADPDFRAFSLESPLGPVAADIMQSHNVNLFADQLLVKEPGTAEPTPWHQDQPYWPLSGSQLCTIWVALDPVTLDSGAVEYVRGSHLWGKWFKPVSFAGDARYAGLQWEDCPDFDAHRDEFEYLHWEVEPGDCVIHHPLVVHGADGNKRADIYRRAIAPRYAGDDVRFSPLPGVEPRRDPGLMLGSRLDREMYPRVWPK